jgi:hypothetical protein
LVPLLQHNISYNGPDTSTTSIRLIAIQSLPENFWAKLDARIPIEWENDKAVPATVNMQLGKPFSPSFGAYADVQAGIGGDKRYDWSVGLGIRYNY